MKGLIKTLNLLFITVLGGLLVVYLQGYFAPSSRDGVQAQAIAGPWAPRPDSMPGKLVDISKEWDLITENNSIIRIVITNNGPNTINKGKLRFDREYLFPDVLLTSEAAKEGVYFPKASNISLPPINPGGRLTIFAWSEFGFGWPDFLNDAHVYSELGEIPINTRTHEDSRGYGDEENIDSFWEYVVAYWWLSLPVLGTIMFFLSYLGDYLSLKYIRKLVMDEDFWISERQKLETVGAKAFVPSFGDSNISPELNAKFEPPNTVKD